MMERLPNTEAFELYHSIKERRYKYYRIYENEIMIKIEAENDN